MYFEWLSDYSVAVKIIDEQHKMFLNTLNKLYDLAIHAQDESKMKEVFEELSNYSSFHFATEEKYFNEFHYEGIVEHQEAHRQFKERLMGFERRISDLQKNSFDLVDFLEHWLVDHIHNLDKKYAKCFHEHGLF